MTQVIITNAGGTLNCDAIEHRERQTCKFPVRSVPTRTSGSFVDDGTYTLKNRRLFMTIRLTDAEKTTLQAIFDQSVVVTITMKLTAAAYPAWVYTAWFEQKPIIYEYSSGGSTREWLAELVFVCGFYGGAGPYEYIEACPCDRADGFETGAKAGFWEVIVGDPYAIQTTHKHCGTYGAYSEGGDGNGIWQHSLSGTNVTKWFKWHYKIVPNPDSPPSGAGAGRLLIVELTNGSLYFWINLYIMTGGSPSPRFRLVDDDGGYDEGTHTLADDTWYCVRLKIVTDGINITSTLYVNGDQDCNLVTPKAGYDTFYYLFLEQIAWTFGRNCQTALDCWCEVDGDDSDICELPSSCWG